MLIFYQLEAAYRFFFPLNFHIHVKPLDSSKQLRHSSRLITTLHLVDFLNVFHKILMYISENVFSGHRYFVRGNNMYVFVSHVTQDHNLTTSRQLSVEILNEFFFRRFLFVNNIAFKTVFEIIFVP